MVTATKGVLVTCDKQTCILIKHIHDQQLKISSQDIIIIKELDDQTLLISPHFVDFVKSEIAKHQEANVYTRAIEGNN